ncbi:MAG: FAD-dependent oxidoreductase [Acidobacteria bacterium]|nr:FAD-dependent oxidoreductase [Acidobacteriota bacterium]
MRVVVVGAGVFGVWTAKCLADAGHTVTLIDAYGPANGRASSADHSRVIRAGYGADIIYSRWATESLAAWLALADATGRTLLAKTGALFMGEPGNVYVRTSYETLRGLRLPVEWIEPDDLARRFPHIATTGLGGSVLEAQAGVIRARAAVQAVLTAALATGRVSYVTARCEPPDEQRDVLALHLTGGRALAADGYVFACGAWLPQLFPVAVGGCIRPTRQEVLHFGVPSGDARFAASQMPVWIEFAAGRYGIPDLDAMGFKVGVDRHGAVIDPDADDRIVDREVVDETRAWMAQRFPLMADAPLVDARVCQYENTSTGDFVLDRHPQWANCWIAGGGSGHGFKHGPAVGRHVAALVTGDAQVEPRFSLATKTSHARRAVY